MIECYYDRPTPLLPKEDVAVIIWGNKVTDNISSSIRFHASKEVARKYLGNQKNKSWPNDRFGKIDWEHLDLVLKNKPNMYKIWRSKQNLGFCGTGVQVGLYSGTAWPNKRCSNCGCRETAAHLLIHPNEDRTQLLIKNTDKLGKWLERDNIMDSELSYWTIKYILMRGAKPFTEMGAMPPHMKALAVSQDVIGYAISWKETYQPTSTRFRISTWQCPAAISMDPTGPSNLSPNCCTLHTLNCFIGTNPYTTRSTGISTTRKQKR
jgi:hypothetical protein